MNGSNRRTIPVTCATHGGTPGYTNLVISKRDGNIQLDPHADGSCVIILAETGGRALCDALQQWLG